MAALVFKKEFRTLPFNFSSKIAQFILWGVLVLVLLTDTYSVWNIYNAQVELTTFMKVFFSLGFVLKLSILYCLIESKGPIKGLTYTWGGLFAVSGSTGLLSFALSEDIEPVQAYFDKSLFLAAGIALIFIASNYISYAQAQEN